MITSEKVKVLRPYRLAFDDFLPKVFQLGFGVLEAGLCTLNLGNDLFQVWLFPLQPHQILSQDQNWESNLFTGYMNMLFDPK